jgi:hypothetical protein
LSSSFSTERRGAAAGFAPPFLRVRLAATLTLRGGAAMLLWILLIIIVIIVFGLGFLFKALLYVALALFVLWLLGLIISLFRRR